MKATIAITILLLAPAAASENGYVEFRYCDEHEILVPNVEIPLGGKLRDDSGNDLDVLPFGYVTLYLSGDKVPLHEGSLSEPDDPKGKPLDKESVKEKARSYPVGLGTGTRFLARRAKGGLELWTIMGDVVLVSSVSVVTPGSNVYFHSDRASPRYYGLGRLAWELLDCSNKRNKTTAPGQNKQPSSPSPSTRPAR